MTEPYRVGDDGQTIHRGDEMVAMGCSQPGAEALVQRLNSEPARQEDVDLLLWLLAEARDNIDWWHRMGEVHLRTVDKLVEERDAARTSLVFWGVVGETP